MADKLRQVGRYINETEQNNQYVLDRYYQIIPKVYRAKDILSPDLVVSIYFVVDTNNQRCMFSLNCMEPPTGRTRYPSLPGQPEIPPVTEDTYEAYLFMCGGGLGS